MVGLFAADDGLFFLKRKTRACVRGEGVAKRVEGEEWD